jgi:hypothetical protein
MHVQDWEVHLRVVSDEALLELVCYLDIPISALKETTDPALPLS